MKITRSQMEMITAATEERFASTLISFLATNYPVCSSLPHDLLVARARKAIEKARRFGLRQQNTTATWVVAMFVVGPDFDEFPPVTRALQASLQNPDQRFAELKYYITKTQWIAAWKASNPKRWDGDLETDTL